MTDEGRQSGDDAEKWSSTSELSSDYDSEEEIMARGAVDDADWEIARGGT